MNGLVRSRCPGAESIVPPPWADVASTKPLVPPADGGASGLAARARRPVAAQSTEATDNDVVGEPPRPLTVRR